MKLLYIYPFLQVKSHHLSCPVVEDEIGDSYMHYLALLYYPMPGTALSPG
jgi:hypothetical protein